MTFEDIKKEVQNLSLTELGMLSSVMYQSIGAKRKVNRERLCAETGHRYVDAMNSVLNIDIRDNCRDREHTWGRSFVIWQMWQDGFSEPMIGKVIDRDHSTINYCKLKVKAAFEMPSFYKAELGIWNLFKEAIQ